MKDSTRFSGGGAAKQAQPEPALARAQVRLITIGHEQAGQRIDNFLLRVCKGVPKSHVYQVLRSGQVRVNKGRITQTYRLAEGDTVRVPPMRLPEPAQQAAPAAEFPVLFEDDALLIIDKPAGVAVHGGSGVSHGVIEQLRASRPTLKFLELVHRLDRETSGILMLAKNRSALTTLHEQIRLGQLDKRYLVLVSGDWQHRRQHIKLPLFKYTTPDGERRVRVQADGQPSHTVFNLLRKYGGCALLEAELKTGRTHQIRVHLASSGFPIAGDDKYGDFALNRDLQKRDGQRLPLKRMFLHAYRLRLMHPMTAVPLEIEATLPKACVDFLQSLETKPHEVGSETCHAKNLI
ncbi:MAG: RluA family pseudouridine synthase [Burkholderiaceae bacterium]